MLQELSSTTTWALRKSAKQKESLTKMMKEQTDFDKIRMRISFQVNLFRENLRQTRLYHVSNGPDCSYLI